MNVLAYAVHLNRETWIALGFIAFVAFAIWRMVKAS